jgi:hypothetical protein
MTHEPEPPFGRRSRLEDEVLEILTRSDRPPSFLDRGRASVRDAARRLKFWLSFAGPNIFAHFGAGSWLVACLVLGVIAYAVRNLSPFLARTLVVICLGLIVFAIVRSFARPSRGTIKRWRGRDIDISPRTRPLWIDRVFRGQRRPPRR